MHNYHSKVLHNTATSTRNPNYTIALPASLMGGALLITYFLILALLGYETVTELRFFNFIIMIPVIIYALSTYVNSVHKKNYMEAFRVSVLSFMGSYVILAVFMFLYLMVLNPDFMTYLQTVQFPTLKLNAFGVFAMLMGEGSIAAVVLTFVAMQHYKTRIKRIV